MSREFTSRTTISSLIFPHRPYLRYTSVVALVACALTANYFLSSFVEPDYLVTFLTVVLLSAWFGGRMAGFLAAGLTAAALLMPFETGSTARFATYLLSAVVFAYLAGELRLMSSRWEATLCSIGDGVVVIDRQGYVRFLNPAAEAMTGWTARDAKKKRMEEVVRLTDETAGELLSSPLTALLEEGQTFRATRPKRLVSRDGHEVWVEESSAPIRNEGNAVVGAILLFRDVTARQELQDQVNQSQRMDAIGRR